jgi:CheY-like chemotaxis protein
MLLEGEGYCVDTAENGQVGLQRLRTDVPPCLILLDLSMPVMDGHQFRREQLADPQLAHIPVVVCSANRPERVNAEELKAAAYLTKPVDIDALLSTIHAFAEP